MACIGRFIDTMSLRDILGARFSLTDGNQTYSVNLENLTITLENIDQPLRITDITYSSQDHTASIVCKGTFKMHRFIFVFSNLSPNLNDIIFVQEFKRFLFFTHLSSVKDLGYMMHE